MTRWRFGIIGAGGITHGHVRNLMESSEAEVVAVADPNPASIGRFRQATGISPSVHADYRDMLAAGGIDCVLISSPHTMHYAQSRDCLEAGLHVLCEKPMVCSAAEAGRLLRDIERCQKTFMIAYQRHVDPRYRWMYDQLHSSALGRVTAITALSSQEWLSLAAGTWRQDPALSGGGQLYDTGSHFVDVLIWLGGPVEEVVAYQDFRSTQVDINSTIGFRYHSGALGSLTILGDTHTWWEDWTISAEGGTLLFRNGRLYRAQLGQGVQEVPTQSLPPPPAVNIDRAFLDVVAGRAEPLVPATVGLGVIQLSEAASRSAASGGHPIRVADL